MNLSIAIPDPATVNLDFRVIQSLETSSGLCRKPKDFKMIPCGYLQGKSPNIIDFYGSWPQQIRANLH